MVGAEADTSGVGQFAWREGGALGGCLAGTGAGGHHPGNARMPLRPARWERQLAAEAFTLGKRQGLGSLGKAGSWGPGVPSLWPGAVWYQQGGWARARVVLSYLWIRVGREKHSS